MRSRRAIGVELDDGKVLARREVVVCAGAFETPKSVALSGLGDGDELQDLGIAVVNHLPGVGRNLLDHPEGTVMWESAKPIPPETSQYWDAACFARSEPGLSHPDLMIHFGATSADLEGALAAYPSSPQAFCMTPNVMYPRSRGRLRLRSTDPADPPLLDFGYFGDADGYDLEKMVAGLRLARRIAASPALAPWVARELAPGPEAGNDSALADYALATNTTVSHPCGTCRMGATDDELGVIDPGCGCAGSRGCGSPTPRFSADPWGQPLSDLHVGRRALREVLSHHIRYDKSYLIWCALETTGDLA